MEGVVLVYFTETVTSEDEAHRIIEEQGFTIKEFLRGYDAALVEVPIGKEYCIANSLDEVEEIDFTMLNFILHITDS